MIRVSFVGLGWVVRHVWLPALHEGGRWEVLGAVDPNTAAFDEIRHQQGIKALVRYTDIEELVRAKPDLVIVASPNALHAAHASAILRAGIAVLVEKPACLTKDEATAISDAAAQGKVPLFVSHAARYRADVVALRNLVSAGKVGDIRRLELKWVRARGIPSRGWFTSAQEAGGGVLVDLGWHMVDLGLWLLGQPDISAVTAIASNDFIGQPSVEASWRNDKASDNPTVRDVEDTIVAFLKTSSGVGISIHLAWASHETIDNTAVVVCGTKGAATLRTTFGFSPNRIERPTLEISTFGATESIALPPSQIGQEYGLLLRNIGASYPFVFKDDKGITEMSSLTALIGTIYAAAGLVH
jgi:oxidoreductase